MAQLTIRNVPDDVASRLKRLSREKETSINTLVLSILESAVGTAGRRKRLERYVTWTDSDLAELDEALAAQRVIDDSLWQ